MAIKLNGTTYNTLAEAIADANENPGTYIITVDSTSPNIISTELSGDVPVVLSGRTITIDGVGNGAASATLVASKAPEGESLLSVQDGGVLNIRDVTVDASGVDVFVALGYGGGDGAIEQVRFTNIRIQEGPFTSGTGVLLEDGANVAMKNVAFDHMGSAGVMAGQTAGPGGDPVVLTIDGFDYTGAGVPTAKADIGIYLTGGVTATIQNASIRDNLSGSYIYSESFLSGGIVVVNYSDETPTSVTISNTSVTNSSAALIAVDNYIEDESGITINLLGGNTFAGNTINQSAIFSLFSGFSDTQADVLILGEVTVNGSQNVDGTILWDSSPYYFGGFDDDALADVVTGGMAGDFLSGGLGADTLTGNGGIDRFYGFSEELDGDTITDIQHGETIVVTDAIAPTATLVGETLTIDVDGNASTTDDRSTMTLKGASGIVTVQGNTITYVSASPRLAVPLVDQVADEDRAFTFTIPADAFGSLEAAAAVGSTITYSATLADGAPLPSWLKFDPATRTFSGTPADANVGAIAVKVTVTDGTTTASDVFALAVKDDHVFTAASSYSLEGSPLVEELTFTGIGNFVGTGNARDNEITGGAGNDTLNGLAGNDRMIGGAGNDTYFVAEGGDAVVEAEGGGVDTVISSLTLTLGANVENLTLADAATALDGIGNHLDNVITGNGLGNALVGGLGGDTLFGGEGQDVINGEDGNDTLVGGGGRDILIGGFGADLFDFNILNETRRGKNSDVIRDFNGGVDEIDLRTIDANADAEGNQRFSWVKRGQRDAEFSGEAGELRFADGMLSGDVDGDGRADFQIKIVGNLILGDVSL